MKRVRNGGWHNWDGVLKLKGALNWVGLRHSERLHRWQWALAFSNGLHSCAHDNETLILKNRHIERDRPPRLRIDLVGNYGNEYKK